MFTVNGRLISKSLLKEGVGEHGEWKIIEFVIQRSFNKKKIKLAFTTGGKRAELVNSIPYKEKITVTFIPSCYYSEKHNKHFVELKAIEVDKYVPKKRVDVFYDGERLNESDYHLKKDNQLDFREKNGTTTEVQNTKDSETPKN